MLVRETVQKGRAHKGFGRLYDDDRGRKSCLVESSSEMHSRLHDKDVVRRWVDGSKFQAGWEKVLTVSHGGSQPAFQDAENPEGST